MNSLAGTGTNLFAATPGRIVDHLENTRGFHLKSIKFLVMDEADRILNMDFEEEVDKLLAEIPKVCCDFYLLAPASYGRVDSALTWFALHTHRSERRFFSQPQ